MRQYMLECDDYTCRNDGGEMEINEAGDIKVTGKFRIGCPREKLEVTNIHQGYGYYIACDECGGEITPMELAD
jgi:hypothetical protein